MTRSGPEISPQILSARIAEILVAGQKIAFASLAPDLRILSLSPNLMAILGEPDRESPGPETLLTDILWEFVGAESQLALILAGEIPSYEIDRVNRYGPEGAVRYLNMRVVPLEAANPGGGLLVLVEDDTLPGIYEQNLVQDRNELKLAQQALARAHRELQRLDRLKSMFMSIVVHDMRGPLTSMLGFTELVRSTLPDNSPKNHEEFLATVSSQIQRLSRLVGDLLDLDQIETGALKIKLEDCNLSEQVQLTVASLAEDARQKHLDLSAALPEHEILVRADTDRVQQILLNLLGNAIKYTGAGGKINLQVQEEKTMGVVSIWNSGPGLTDEEQDHLFELYYRTEDARQSRTQGSGLGLFIVKSLVEAHSGAIEVSSVKNQGTTFTVRLPRAGGLSPRGDFRG